MFFCFSNSQVQRPDVLDDFARFAILSLSFCAHRLFLFVECELLASLGVILLLHVDHVAVMKSRTGSREGTKIPSENISSHIVLLNYKCCMIVVEQTIVCENKLLAIGASTKEVGQFRSRRICTV